MADWSARTGGEGTNDELLPPPPPVSPPRLTARASGSMEELPGYVAPSSEEGERFRQANLPRRIPDLRQPTNFRLARPGEKLPNGQDPPLYDVWASSYKAMDEFGIGVGLYYRQLLLLGVVIMICVIVYIPSIVHNAGFADNGSSFILTGTAHGAERDDISLNLNGVPDLIVTLMLVLFSVAFRKLEKIAVEIIDTAQQTPQDYSVCIHKPPRVPELVNPDTYYEKFRTHGEIVFITICFKNGNLMKAVAKKRVIEHKIHALKAHENMAAKDNTGKQDKASRTTADLKKWQAWLQAKLGLFETKDYLENALQENNERLEGLAHGSYEPSRVYITFQTEHAQRKCLKAVETGLWEEYVSRWRKKDVNQEAVIGGKVCRIDEAEEPSEILWENIDTTIYRRAVTWALAGFLSVMFLTSGFFVLRAISGTGSWVAAIFIALINAVLPLVIRGLTLAIEEHKSLTHVQASMMFKLVVTRGINTAFLLFIITGDTEQLDSATLQQIMLILLADAFTTPFLRLTNVADQIGRKLVGSKAKTQAEMNVFFQGAQWNLAERYTDMIKTVFVGLFYSAIVPTGLIVTAVAMVSLYWVDKYSLLRQWKRPPAYNGSLSTYTRKYIVVCIWLHLVMARIFFAKWPSKKEEELPDCNLYSCNYPEDQENFYTEDQKAIVHIYEILGVLLFAIGGGILLVWYMRHYATKLVITKHEEVGIATTTEYRSVKGIDAYIPLIKVRELTDPLLAMDVNDLPENAHSYLPLRIGGFYDAAELSMNSIKDFPNLSKQQRDNLFGKVKYYPGRGEQMHLPRNQGGFVFNNNGNEYQQPAGTGDFGGGIHRFGLTRQSSQLENASFMLPSSPVKEISAPMRSNKTQSREALLPDGWEERKTETGRRYYVSHETRTTQWQRPTAPAASGNSSSFFGNSYQQGGPDIHSIVRDLPAGWEVRYLPNGRPYYVDHNTHQTHWERPSRQPQTSTPAVAAVGHPASPVDPSAGGTELMEHYTAAGLKYYVNPRTNEAVWSPPKGGRRRLTKGSAGIDGSVDATARGSRLPSGWERRATPAGREYFVNHDRRITQWTPPDSEEQKSQVAAPPLAAGAFNAGNVGDAAGIFGNFEGGNQRAGGGARVSDGGLFPPLKDQGGLPGHIEARVHADGRTYYVNHRTQVTSWTPPEKGDW